MANIHSAAKMLPYVVVATLLTLPAELRELIYLWCIFIAEQNAEATGAGFEVPYLFIETISQLSGIIPTKFPTIPREMFNSVPGLKAHALAFVTPQIFWEYLKVYRLYRRDERFKMPFMSLTMGVSGNLKAASSLIRQPLLACRIRIHIVPGQSKWIFENVFNVIRGFPNMRELEFVTHRYIDYKGSILSCGSKGIGQWLNQCPFQERVTVRFVDVGLVVVEKRAYDLWMVNRAAAEAKDRFSDLPYLEARRFANAANVLEIIDLMEAKRIKRARDMLEALQL